MTGNIIGNQNPLAGTTYSYEVKPSLLSFGLKGEYEWYLYKKQKNGTWKDITGKPKTGEKVTYRFGEIAVGIEFQMKVYEIKKGILPGLPANKELAGTLILIPTSDKVSKIDKVVLFNRGAANVNKASYRDTLIAQAHCIGMFNKEIEFHLWEDDAPGKGHNPVVNKNNRHTRSYKALVNAKGIAEVQIPLMSDEKILRQMANQFMMKGDKNEGANHEYYVTASYSGQIQGASQVNVDVANPDYKGQSQNQPKPQPKPQPQKNPPKLPAGSGNASKQPDPKGNIIEAVFIDDKGNELSKVAVGDKVRVRIHSKNMVGKHIQYVVWEYDTTSNDEVYRSGYIKIPADVCDTSGFVITKDIFEKGIDSPIGDPDSDKQNYFIEIISKDLSAESQKFGVNPEGLMQVEKLKSAAVVQNTQDPKPENGKCPRCKKLTEDELKKVFPTADSKLITEIVNSFNEYSDKFNINTCTLKAHFFAQAKQESSDSLSPAINGESMNYSVNGLLNTGLKNVSSKYKFGNKTGLEMAKELGRKDGEGALSLERQIKIANFIYGLNPKAKDLGNKAPTDNKDLEEANNEGWRYRGRGMLQITGKHNYTEIENHVNSIVGKNILDIKSGRKYDSKFTPTEALLSGLGDWSFHKMYIPAKKGVTKEACLEVIKIINSATKSKTKRIAHLIGGNWYSDDDTTKKAHTIKIEDSMKVIFRVDECLSKEVEPVNTTTSKVVIKFGENADKSVVSEKSLNILREVGEKTKNYIITITSTARDPYNQARVMYDNIVKKGMKEQRNTYKAPGQKVLDTYENAKTKGKNKQEIIKEMEAKIKELGPKNVSKHCEDPRVTNVFDITQTMSNPKDFKREIASRVDKILDENACYHIEIKQ